MTLLRKRDDDRQKRFPDERVEYSRRPPLPGLQRGAMQETYDR